MLGRRSFLTLLGIAPVAAKSAGVEAVSAIQGVTGVSPLPQEATSPGQALSDGSDGQKGLKWLASGKIPIHVDGRLKRDAYYVHSLDPDLVVNRSMSWSAKVLIQRQRNYERAKTETVEDARRRIAARALPEWLRQLW